MIINCFVGFLSMSWGFLTCYSCLEGWVNASHVLEFKQIISQVVRHTSMGMALEGYIRRVSNIGSQGNDW